MILKELMIIICWTLFLLVCWLGDAVSSWETHERLTSRFNALAVGEDGMLGVAGSVDGSPTVWLFTPSGQIRWIFGAKRPYGTISSIVRTEGGWIVAGHTLDTSPSSMVSFAAFIRDDSVPMWRVVLHKGAVVSANKITKTPQGHLLIVGDTGDQDGQPARLLIHMLDVHGRVLHQLMIPMIERATAVDVIMASDNGFYVVFNYATTAYILVFDEHNRVLRTESLPFSQVNCIESSRDGGYVVVGQRYSASIRRLVGMAMKVKSDHSIEWLVECSKRQAASVSAVINAKSGGYTVVGAYRKEGGSEEHFLMLAALSSNGTIKWEKRSNHLSKGKAIVQGPDGSYYAIGDYEFSFGYLLKYQEGDDEGTEGCSELIICKRCGFGFYWTANDKRCVPCSPDCLRCINSSHCIECANDFTIDANTSQCLPRVSKNGTNATSNCDCTNWTNPSLCMEVCNRTYCANQSTTPHTEGNARYCVCPNGTVDNGTHCIQSTNMSCVPLCLRCLQSNGSQCLECVPSALSKRSFASSLVCVCVCDDQSEMVSNINGSECRLRKLDRNEQQSGSRTWLVALGLLGTFIAFASVVWTVYRKCTSYVHFHNETSTINEGSTNTQGAGMQDTSSPAPQPSQAIPPTYITK